MEHLDHLMSFIAANPLITLGIFIFVLRNQTKNSRLIFDKVHDIRKQYFNKTMSYLEQRINNMYFTVMGTASEKVKNLKTSCPNGSKSCEYPKSDISNQLEIYKWLGKDVLVRGVFSAIKTKILRNGYHTMSPEDLETYIIKHGTFIHDDAANELRELAKDSIPDIYKSIGHNYGPEAAIALFRDVVRKSIINDNHRDKAIQDVYKEYYWYNSALFKKIASIFNK